MKKTRKIAKLRDGTLKEIWVDDGDEISKGKLTDQHLEVQALLRKSGSRNIRHRAKYISLRHADEDEYHPRKEVVVKLISKKYKLSTSLRITKYIGRVENKQKQNIPPITYHNGKVIGGAGFGFDKSKENILDAIKSMVLKSENRGSIALPCLFHFAISIPPGSYINFPENQKPNFAREKQVRDMYEIILADVFCKFNTDIIASIHLDSDYHHMHLLMKSCDYFGNRISFNPDNLDNLRADVADTFNKYTMQDYFKVSATRKIDRLNYWRSIVEDKMPYPKRPKIIKQLPKFSKLHLLEYCKQSQSTPKLKKQEKINTLFSIFANPVVAKRKLWFMVAEETQQSKKEPIISKWWWVNNPNIFGEVSIKTSPKQRESLWPAVKRELKQANLPDTSKFDDINDTEVLNILKEMLKKLKNKNNHDKKTITEHISLMLESIQIDPKTSNAIKFIDNLREIEKAPVITTNKIKNKANIENNAGHNNVL